MPHFFIILLKINLVLILFAAAYYFILRRLTFYVINRFFLTFGILFSTIYPFIDLTDFFHRQNPKAVAFVPGMNQTVSELVPSEFIIVNWQLLTALFYVGVVFMAFRLIVQFFSLYKMHKKSSPGSVANFQVRILDEPVSPFSFWQTVYINPTLHKERELETILAHEQIHVKQWHSLDIILAELSVVFYWFNPGVWLMKKAVKENLEFITDEKILKKGVDKKAYQYSLLDVGNLMPAVQIVNNFNLSDLKKRIKMMNVKRSSKLTLSRYMLVLPVLLLTTLAFTVSKKDIKKHLAPIKDVLITANIIEKDEIPVLVKKQIRIKKKNNRSVVNLSLDTTPKISLVINTIHLETDSLNAALPYAEQLGNLLLSRKKGNPVDALYGKVVGRVIMLKSDSVTVDGKNQIVASARFNFENVEKNTVITGKPYAETVIVKAYKRGTKVADSVTKGTGAVIFLNGEKITKEELNKVNPQEIKNISIQKSNPLTEVTVIGTKKKAN